MFKKYYKYLFYASSIIISRGLEYVVLFYAALYLSKDDYGELEFYKKIIELLAVGLAFGLPSLLLTYTKSSNSKIYFNLLGFIFICGLSILTIPLFWAFNYEFLIIPVLFHAIFFNNGIMPVFFLTKLGSNKASFYKIVLSILFYIGVLLLLVLHPNPERAFIIINYYLIGFSLLFVAILFYKYEIVLSILKKYLNLFKRLILSSLTLVVSNFANMMFLYTDIMILKAVSKTPNVDIANYSFALNVANILVLIPLTMVQVDIEKIKKGDNITQINARTIKLLLVLSSIIIGIYFLLINVFYTKYDETFYLFLVIVLAKFFQSMSIIHGALILIKKRFKANLKINLSVLLFNLVVSIILFKFFHVYGLAFSSALSLTIRYILLKKFSNYKFQ